MGEFKAVYSSTNKLHSDAKTLTAFCIRKNVLSVLLTISGDVNSFLSMLHNIDHDAPVSINIIVKIKKTTFLY